MDASHDVDRIAAIVGELCQDARPEGGQRAKECEGFGDIVCVKYGPEPCKGSQYPPTLAATTVDTTLLPALLQ
ncbi:MAG: hypothetical protein M1837_003368 [Sclerophora amabilis]|nr:MAG: hypothetical protein M1837_003368 [Sclerophora amabilis]